MQTCYFVDLDGPRKLAVGSSTGRTPIRTSTFLPGQISNGVCDLSDAKNYLGAIGERVVGIGLGLVLALPWNFPLRSPFFPVLTSFCASWFFFMLRSLPDTLGETSTLSLKMVRTCKGACDAKLMRAYLLKTWLPSTGSSHSHRHQRFKLLPVAKQ